MFIDPLLKIMEDPFGKMRIATIAGRKKTGKQV
jgi:hypothetical protein